MLKQIIGNISIYFYILFTISACYLIPCDFEKGLSEIESKKDVSFFTGEYILEKSMNNHFKNEEAKFLLDKDGKIELIKISSKIFDPYGKKEVVISAINKWKLVYLERENEHRLSLRLDFKQKNEPIKMITSGKFYLKNEKPVVLFEIGDPDECRAIRFIKK